MTFVEANGHEARGVAIAALSIYFQKRIDRDSKGNKLFITVFFYKFQHARI